MPRRNLEHVQPPGLAAHLRHRLDRRLLNTHLQLLQVRRHGRLRRRLTQESGSRSIPPSAALQRLRQRCQHQPRQMQRLTRARMHRISRIMVPSDRARQHHRRPHSHHAQAYSRTMSVPLPLPPMPRSTPCSRFARGLQGKAAPTVPTASSATVKRMPRVILIVIGLSSKIAALMQSRTAAARMTMMMITTWVVGVVVQQLRVRSQLHRGLPGSPFGRHRRRLPPLQLHLQRLQLRRLLRLRQHRSQTRSVSKGI